MSSKFVRTIFEVIPEKNGQVGNVKVNQDALKEVFGRHEIRNLPTVVISINGRERSGKSFMLTQFLKYLSFPNDPDWINKSTSRKFTWNGGMSRVTPGIQVWAEPIIIEVGDKNGEKRKVAIILMDCQGLFDSKTTMAQNYKLFAFSALLSSIFIFNDNKGLSEDVLNFMHSFLEYAKLACASSEAAEMSVFQNLLLLVRDWANDQENADYVTYKCGYYDDSSKPPRQRNHLKTDLFEGIGESEFTEVATKTRRGILKIFQHTAIFALAGPGDCPPIPKDESASNWTGKFRNCVIDFVSHTLDPNKLNSSTKCLGRDAEITADVLFQVACKWGEALVNSDETGIPTSIEDTRIEAHFHVKINSAQEKYTKEMKLAIQRNPKGMTLTEFNSTDESAMNAAMGILGSPETSLGSDEDYKKFQGQLESKISESRETFLVQNNWNTLLETNRILASTAKEARLLQAQRVLEWTKRDLEAAEQHLTIVHQNQNEYTTIVRQKKKTWHKIFRRPIWNTTSYDMVAQYDDVKFQAAVTDAQTKIDEKRLKLCQAQTDLENAIKGV